MSLSFDPKEEREYTKQEARELWVEARRMAESGNCDFNGWRFPQDPDRIGFFEVTFNVDALCSKGSLFSGCADFRGATFSAGVLFLRAKFIGDAWFYEATFNRSVSFDGVKFSRDAMFHGATFIESVSFYGTTFSGDAGFGGATFGGSVLFFRATFEQTVDFWLPPRLPFKPKVFRHPGDAAIAYRLAKQAAQDHGDYRMAGKYHFAEQCATNALEFKYGIDQGDPVGIGASINELIFARLLFGYGEKPRNPLFAALFIIFFWAFLFWHFNGIEPDSQENIALGQATTIARVTPSEPEIESRPFEECLYFSIVTFTTLGYGDMRPTDDIGHRLLAGSEALLGVAIMALFIVSLARKYTR